MCLKTVSKTEPEPRGYGWKVFERRKGKLYSLYPHVTDGAGYLTNQWIKAKCTQVVFLIPMRTVIRSPEFYLNTYHRYIPQFHILLTKPVKNDPYDMTKLSRIVEIVTRKVRYRKAQVIGVDATYDVGKCVVAGEIYIYKKKGDK